MSFVTDLEKDWKKVTHDAQLFPTRSGKMIRFLLLIALVTPLDSRPSFGRASVIVADTRVLVGSADDPGVFSEKRIEDIAVGDEVWTRPEDDADAPMELKKVTAVEQHTAYDLQKVSVRSGDGNIEILDVTDEHPFFTEDRGWVGAADLYIGELLVSPDGTVRIVVGNADDQRPEGITVYNFTVEGDHTYFVADGQGTVDEFVWVHNACQAPLHHIATDKHKTEWTPQFQKLFDKAGMSLQDARNLVRVPGHVGQHPDWYHEIVFNRLSNAVRGLRGGTSRYAQAFSRELAALKHDAETPGKILNFLATHAGPN